MGKTNCQIKIKNNQIKSEEIRRAFLSAAQAFEKTPGYLAAKESIEKISTQYKYFDDMTNNINRQINSLGIPQAIRTATEQYISILKDSQPKRIFLSPGHTNRFFLAPDMIEKIAERSAEKAFERLNEKIRSEKRGLKKVQPLNITPGTKWSNITMKIINENDVEILIGNRKSETNYKKMGFEDARTKRPNKQWIFLWFLATKNGTLSWEDYRRSDRIMNLSLRDIYKFKKTKQSLANALKYYFQINDDPFYSYRKEKAYRIKINLTATLN